MFRRLIILFLVFASLAGQASTAYACEMMNVAAAANCCCPGGDGLSVQADGESCCQTVQLADSAVQPTVASLDASGIKLPSLDPAPLPTSAWRGVAAPLFSRNLAPWEYQVAVASFPGLDVYLATQRLRL